jgi:Family of unknown function (DUF5343)
VKDFLVATEIPYMQSSKNLGAILDKIATAGTPPKFTHEFLRSNLGFTSSGDRSVVRVLRAMGFLTADSVPTPRYNEFRDAGHRGQALAAGLREGWADAFLSDEAAHTRTPSELKELFKNITGKGESAAEKMASTFKILADRATWTEEPTDAEPAEAEPEVEAPDDSAVHQRLRLHHDIHVHLPPTSDVAVYTAIFRALRQELGV